MDAPWLSCSVGHCAILGDFTEGSPGQRKHLMASHHSKFISPATVGVPAAVMQYPLQGLL